MVPGTDDHFACTPTSSRVKRLFVPPLVFSCFVLNTFVTRTKHEFDSGVNSVLMCLGGVRCQLTFGKEKAKFCFYFLQTVGKDKNIYRSLKDATKWTDRDPEIKTRCLKFGLSGA